MSKLRFDGQANGLGVRMADGSIFHPRLGVVGRAESGDRNDPLNYSVICQCEKDLGPLQRFRPNADGYRSIQCIFCSCCTIVDKACQIVRVLTPHETKEALEKQKIHAGLAKVG